MPDDFNPYHKWLGIPLKDQPPNLYRLLAIELFEHDLDVIANAVDQRMVYVRTFAAGKNADWSQRLLNEISAAGTCLLDAKRKASYDQRLRVQLTAPRNEQTQSADDADQETLLPDVGPPNDETPQQNLAETTQLVSSETAPISREVYYPDALPAMAAIGIPDLERLNGPAKKRWR